MVKKLLVKFSLRHEREEAAVIIETITKGVVFRGTNLWILIFAIFIASLGLNVNSTAVIIGAMLISPLMGPIMGLGLGIGINDLDLLRKSFYNYCVATAVALATSTLFFLLSPLNEAHSEILARTSPNIYDVLIALFGGLAGIIATSSKQKGNVITGVAIATALMPPLCTAGYGLATFKWEFFVGAFYLFIINTVFIALATFLAARFLQFPYKQLPDKRADARAKRILWAIVIITIVPSIYFGYDIVQQNNFISKAERFIVAEGNFKNDYLLSKKIEPKNRQINLVYGGAEINKDAIEGMRSKLRNFDLAGAVLEVHQGFAYLATVNKSDDHNEQMAQLNLALNAKDAELLALRKRVDSLSIPGIDKRQVFEELKTQHADLNEALFSTGNLLKTDSTAPGMLVVLLRFRNRKTGKERSVIEQWLKVRFRKENIKTVFL